MKSLAVIGLLAASIALTATPALAKDRHYSSDRQYEAHSDRHRSYNHDYRRGSKHHYRNYDRRHDYGRHYGHKRYHRFNDSHRYYGHRYYYRSHDYVDDYFVILGGTILINELLYHSHERH